MKSRKLLALLSASAMSLSLFGCGGSGSSTGGSTGGTASADETFKVGTTQELSGIFNPMYSSSAYDQWIVNMVYQNMLEFNADDELYPNAAAGYEISEDGTELTFHMKEGQKFSDGTTLDGDDVKYTFTLYADPEYVGGYQDGSFNFIEGFDDYMFGDAEEVSGITVSDDKMDVTFKLATPDIDALATIAQVYLMSDEQFEYTKGNLDDYKNLDPMNVVGSGAYKINHYDKASGASVVLNENYTGDGDYKIKQIIVKTIAEGTEVASLESGEIDLLPEEIDNGIIGPASLLENVKTSHYFRPAEGYVGFNCQTGPTDDVAVRQALAYATNREEFAEAYFQWPDGKAAEDIKDVSVGYVPKVFWSPVAETLGAVTTGEMELEGLVTYDYDLEKAKQILDDAGWKPGADGIREKDGKKLEIKFLVSEGNSVLEMLIPIITKSWTELGVNLVTNTVDFNTLLTTVDPTNEETRNEWNAFFMVITYTGLSNTTMNQVEGFTGTIDKPVAGGSNYGGLFDEELNNLLNAGKQTADDAVSVENYSKAMVRSSELCGYLPIYGNNLFNLMNKRVQNLNMGPVCGWSKALAGAYLGEAE